MYFRHLLRTQLVGLRAAQLLRLHPEVSALKINSLILINILFSSSAAEHLDNSCPVSSGGVCGKPAAPQHREVWFVIVPLHLHKMFCFVC